MSDGRVPSPLVRRPDPPNVSQYGYSSEIDGWLVEQKVLSQESLLRIPDSLSYEEALRYRCAALTAWSALTLGTVIRSGHSAHPRDGRRVHLCGAVVEGGWRPRARDDLQPCEGGPIADARGRPGRELGIPVIVSAQSGHRGHRFRASRSRSGAKRRRRLDSGASFGESGHLMHFVRRP